MTDFVTDRYFQSVIDAMKKKGFVLFSRVEITNDDLPCVLGRTTASRNTALFFHVPNKCMIVHLALRELDSLDMEPGIYGTWAIGAYARYATGAEFDEKGQPRDLPLHDVFRNRVNYPDGFRPGNFTGACAQKEPKTRETQITGEELSEAVMVLVGTAMPYLRGLPFNHLNVVDFPPRVMYPGCEGLFWRRFKEGSAKTSSPRYLWSLIDEPFGSVGLMR